MRAFFCENKYFFNFFKLLLIQLLYQLNLYDFKMVMKNNKTILIFYFLIAYVILQFIWWGYHIYSLTGQLNNSEAYIDSRLKMIAGEGTVFIIIICLGAIYVIRSFYKDINLSKKEKNFALSVTHELKTPIASSKLFAETLLQREDLSKSQVKTSLEKIIYEQNRLNELVEKILLVSTIDEMKNDIHIKPISFYNILNQVIEEGGNSHKISNKIPDDIVFNGDDFYLISLFQNLLDNAKKYSPKDSEINFYAENHPTKIIIYISDQGVGIKDVEKLKIFDRFYRIEDEDTRSSKGTGLGLFLVNQIVKMHGGKIACKDNIPNGCIFQIQFKK